MRETTPDERHQVMHDVIEDLGVPQNFDNMVEAFKEYTRRSHMLRHDDADPAHIEDIKKMADILADMTADTFIYDYVALDYLFKNKGFR